MFVCICKFAVNQILQFVYMDDFYFCLWLYLGVTSYLTVKSVEVLGLDLAFKGEAGIPKDTMQ